MFRVMKLRQNVKGKLLSIVVSLSVLALTIVGAFAVNFKSAAAAAGQDIYLSDLIERVRRNYSGNDLNDRLNSLQNMIADEHYMFIFAVGENDDDIAFSIWSLYGTQHGWVYDNTGKLMDATHNSDPIYREYLFYPESNSQTGYFSYGYQTSFSPRTDTFQFGRSSGGTVYSNYTIFPNTQNFFDSSITFYWSCQFRQKSNTNNVTNQNIYPAPVSAYDAILIQNAGRYYLTASDQDVLQDALNYIAVFQIVFTKESGYEFTRSIDIRDMTYLSIVAYPGISHIPTQGVLAWDISEIVQYESPTSVVFTQIAGEGVDHDYFSDNVVSINVLPEPDLWGLYYDYLNRLNSFYDQPVLVVPDQVPSYVSHQITTNYPGNIFVNYDGRVVVNELPSPGFDQVLVLDASIFNNLNITLGVFSATDQFFPRTFNGDLLATADLIVVLGHQDFNEVVSHYENFPENFRYFDTGSITIGNVSFQHGMWYMTTVRTHVEHEIVYDAYNFVTQRYLQKCNNWILSDGVNFLYDALNAISTNQNNFFSSAISGISAVCAQLQTINGTLVNIDNTISSWNLSDKLQSIVDKLERIANNTSEQTHDYWFISLYNWLLQFAPSNSDFATWVSDLTSFENQLPDPEATPAATVIPFPTVTAAAG